ncbi:hypothetical protein CM19_06995 [Candidatus Acidianus copahuensis]|uniref:Uncharacterized protein n=1 Tax=Candidatus Acidianus copahuensis TaxID=1160895 RepID=A0A031LRS4_9CREN|nr:hypothetical protein [Candidatus Acidianus copahuensis]EZQ07124.1 hypothetical protein CM19_06995 [Candidatus Acidianus copahuensis]
MSNPQPDRNKKFLIIALAVALIALGIGGFLLLHRSTSNLTPSTHSSSSDSLPQTFSVLYGGDWAINDNYSGIITVNNNGTVSLSILNGTKEVENSSSTFPAGTQIKEYVITSLTDRSENATVVAFNFTNSSFASGFFQYYFYVINETAHAYHVAYQNLSYSGYSGAVTSPVINNVTVSLGVAHSGESVVIVEVSGNELSVNKYELILQDVINTF